MTNHMKTGTKSSCLQIPPSDETCVKEALTRIQDRLFKAYLRVKITMKHAPSPSIQIGPTSIDATTEKLQRIEAHVTEKQAPQF
mmetsp:Transcript_19304/g.48054  ORF Transcript_19304/g.48054 Transcript_19304/m.48054 type:complete len:84 (+) Transcript_19304:960-1211(+)